MSFEEDAPGVWRGRSAPPVGALGEMWEAFGAEVVIGHPTFHNADNIERQLADGIRGAPGAFPDRRVAFVVSDGTWREEGRETSTIDAALAGARRALGALGERERSCIQVVVTPYDGYAGDRTPGKGSALKLIFDELGGCDAELLILLDGDLRNDMAAWQRVFAAVAREHARGFGDRPFFVTARYARHFVDASLTRFIVGPLTTLMGRYVPGGISGDIALSSGAVAHERQGAWTDRRRRYGTDISTTFDNAADPDTVIYEVYLGAKLHDITDEGKLSVMPGEVIGAAFERLLYWEGVDGRVSRILRPDATLAPLVKWGPDETGVGFVDPGYTDAFAIDKKLDGLIGRLDDFADDIRAVQGTPFFEALAAKVARLATKRARGELAFLDIDARRWVEILHRAVAYALAHREVEPVARSLNYLYTAAFLELVKARLVDLGLDTLEAVRAAEGHLGVPPGEAEAFYTERVDAVSDRMARAFFEGRGRIAEELRRG